MRMRVLDSALANQPRHYSDRKSTRLNSSHSQISYAVFCLKKKTRFHALEGVSLGQPFPLLAPPRFGADQRAGALAHFVGVQPFAAPEQLGPLNVTGSPLVD